MACVCSLKQVRAKVWQLRTTSDLFNVQIYTANLERVYRRMWERYEKGEEINHLTELAESYS
jgi:protein O-GlcNAc transferase